MNYEFIKRHHIKVEGTDVPPVATNFTKLIQYAHFYAGSINSKQD